MSAKHAKKASLNTRLAVSLLIKQAGLPNIMGMLEQLGAKVSPHLASGGNAIGDAIKGIGFAQTGDKINSAAGALNSASQPMLRGIGMGTVGAGAGLAGLGIHGMMSKNQPEQMQVQAAAAQSIGTPFMDGFITRCLEGGLDSNQVVDLLEKGASAEGKTGEECKAFLDRLLTEK